ncbi:protein NPC2 homolog [Trichogramma pretiosum]|uniref:protein NPC2 homolog n=1 Tax=Trichogramma pretiosum TaxID=7493 RepID=UPI0006C9DF15|nr:protein NPC2 homolog [Trichogramma pretiosum]
MKFICGSIVACLLVATVAATPFTNCQEGAPPSALRVEGCDKAPCKLRRGTNVSAEWDFTVNADTKHLTPRVRATTLGMTVNFPFPQKDACETLIGTSCPLIAGDNVTYKLTMPVARYYPQVSISIEFAFLDDAGQVAVCFKLAAKTA